MLLRKGELLDMLIYEYAHFIDICFCHGVIPYDFATFMYNKFNMKRGFNVYNKAFKNFAKLN